MSLDSALAIANSGLTNISAQLALVSHNVANASTPGYVTEIANQQSVTAEGIGMGVATGPATRDVGAAMQAGIYDQNAVVGGLQTTKTTLSALDTVSGTPGQGQDVASLLGKLQDAFSTLAADPTNQTQQSSVVAAAQTLAGGINTLANAYTAQRQTAENAIASGVTSINQALATIGTLSDQIIRLQAAGQSTADLENQRDAAVSGLSQQVGIKVLEQPNGDMLITTASGTTLPIHSADPLSVTAANVQPGSYYPGGGIGAIMLGGVDVTQQMTGGSLGANLTLRDATLPTNQAELDEFSQNLASRFAAQGLTLFSDPSGSVPAGGGTPLQSTYVGFAAAITVNPAVVASPSLVRDGTNAIIGSALGASAFTPNPAGGPQGFSTLITRVLNFTFGTEAQSGVAQPVSHTLGLGATGTLDAPYTAPADLSGIASTMLASQAQISGTATTALGTAQAVQTSLQSNASAAQGVNIDAQMSTMIALQNAYGANAKVMAGVEQMWTALMSAVTG
ncbi:MAG: flagellar hook-associated protein FlgK [Rhodospirillales bacterium]|nr:flagellar hook-associated protein FlgK [Rhodospirillales bacterium]